MMAHYVLLDAIGIQKYIFQTDKLKIIRGASQNLVGWQDYCRTIGNNAIISSAGGNVLVKFDDYGEAKEFKNKAINNAPSGMEIAWAITESKDTDVKTWKALQQEIARYKVGDRDRVDYPGIIPPARPGCVFCGIRPSGKKIEGSKSICEECWKNSQTEPVDTLLTAPHTDKDEPVEFSFPDNLEDLVRREDKEEFDDLAVVVLDLNNMGKKIKEIINHKSFETFGKFSNDLENNFRKLFRDVINSLKEISGGVNTKEAYYRILPLLLAGDDAIFAMPSPLWIPFIQAVFTKIETADNFFKTQGITACAGVIIAKYNFPINRLFDMAEELVASAKNKHRFLNTNKCVLDWHVHQESIFSSIAEARKRGFVRALTEGSEFEIMTRKPYTYGEFGDALKQAEACKNNKAEACKNNKIANRKLVHLYQALRRGQAETRDALVYTFLRDENEKGDKYKIIWEWIRNATGEQHLWARESKTINGSVILVTDTHYTDILELYFLQNGQEEQ